MKANELKALMGRASDWHNAHSFEERGVLCIASMSQQITTLLSMKQKIRRMADSECRRIDDWINNIARDLKKDLDAIAPVPVMPQDSECQNPECQDGKIYMDSGGDNHTVIDCPDCVGAQPEGRKCVCNLKDSFPSRGPKKPICDGFFGTSDTCLNPACGHPRACHAEPSTTKGESRDAIFNGR